MSGLLRVRYSCQELRKKWVPQKLGSFKKNSKCSCVTCLMWLWSVWMTMLALLTRLASVLEWTSHCQEAKLSTGPSFTLQKFKNCQFWWHVVKNAITGTRIQNIPMKIVCFLINLWKFWIGSSFAFGVVLRMSPVLNIWILCVWALSTEFYRLKPVTISDGKLRFEVIGFFPPRRERGMMPRQEALGAAAHQSGGRDPGSGQCSQSQVQPATGRDLWPIGQP